MLPYTGKIEYTSTAGNHIFYTGGTNERFRTANNGDVISQGFIRTGATSYLYAGGLRISGDDFGNTINQDFQPLPLLRKWHVERLGMIRD